MLKATRLLRLTKCAPCIRTKSSSIPAFGRRAFVTQKKPLITDLVNNHRILIQRSIQLSPKHQLNPVFFFYLKTVGLKAGKYGSMLVSRTLGKMYKRLPEKQRVFVKNLVRMMVGASLACIAYYTYTHYETTPITGRKRLITFTKEQMLEIANFAHLQHQEEVKGHLLPETHEKYLTCKRVLDKLLEANEEVVGVRTMEWGLNVVEDDSTVSAFVVPNGQVYVYTGLVRLADNEDELAVVIGHEMSHVLLGHTQVNICIHF